MFGIIDGNSDLNPVHTTYGAVRRIRRRTALYGDVVIEHVDFYGSVHTHALQHELDLCVMLRCTTQLCPLTTTVSSSVRRRRTASYAV